MGLFASVLGLSLVLGGFNPARTTVNGFPVNDGRPLIAAGVVVCIVVWLNTWRELRQQIVVSTDGLSIRHGMFRSTELIWADVRYVAVARSSRRNIRSEEGVEWPFVTTSSGRRIDVGGLCTLDETSRWSVGENSGARQRIDLVHRFAVRSGVNLDKPIVVDGEPPGLSAAARDGGVFAVGVLVTVLAGF